MGKHRIDASSINPEVLKRALNKAGITDASVLYGKSGTSKAASRGGKQNGSPPHDLLCRALDEASIPYIKEFKNAIPGRRFRLDIALEQERICVEVDGWQHHGRTLSGFKKDREKQNLLTQHNWKILRFTAGDIYRNVRGCVETIRNAQRNCQ